MLIAAVAGLFLAVLAGWTTTEVGRQPWTVYGLMRTAHSVTPSLTGRDVAISLFLYVLVYLVMFPTGFVVMAGLVRRGVSKGDETPAPIEAGRPMPPYVVPAAGVPIPVAWRATTCHAPAGRRTNTSVQR